MGSRTSEAFRLSGFQRPAYRLQPPGQVKRVRRLPAGVESDHFKPIAEHAARAGRAIEECTVVAPYRHDPVHFSRDTSDPLVVARADRVGCGHEILRIRRPECKQIEHPEVTEPPVPGEPDTAPDGRVIALRVCSRGVQTDKHHSGQRCIPLSPQRVAESPAACKMSPFSYAPT